MACLEGLWVGSGSAGEDEEAPALKASLQRRYATKTKRRLEVQTAPTNKSKEKATHIVTFERDV